MISGIYSNLMLYTILCVCSYSTEQIIANYSSWWCDGNLNYAMLCQNSVAFQCIFTSAKILSTLNQNANYQLVRFL